MAVQVSVSNMIGEHLEFQVEQNPTVSMVKDRLYQFWHVPVACQRLVVGDSVPEGELAAYFSPGERLACTMLVSVEDQLAVLRSVDVEKKRAALKVIGELGTTCSEGVAILLQQCDEQTTLKADALEALAQTIGKGDERGTVIAMKYVRHHNARVRAGARMILAKTVAVEFQGRELDELCNGLTDTAIVRVATVAALRHLKGNDYAIAAVERWLGHEDYHVRCSAVQGLAGLFEKGNVSIIETLQTFLKDRDRNVRNVAENALFHLVPTC